MAPGYFAGDKQTKPQSLFLRGASCPEEGLKQVVPNMLGDGFALIGH